MPVRSIVRGLAQRKHVFVTLTLCRPILLSIPRTPSFDAAVGRCILQFLPDPVAALRSVAKQVRPDGIVAFQEVSWAPCVSLSAHLRLWSAAVSLVREAGIHSGVNMEMGPALHNAF